MEGRDKKIMIIFYSMYGHVEKLARTIAEGVNSIPGVTAELWQVPETLHEEVLSKMHAPKKPEDIPVLTHDKLEELTKADGFLFGLSNRFGTMSAQMKSFFDSTGGLWYKGALAGKPAGLFFCTGTQGGGSETVALTTIPVLAHHWMVYVPLGYTFGPEYLTMDEIRGGSAYGAGSYSGSNGSRQPSELELKIAKHQGESFAKFVNRLN